MTNNVTYSLHIFVRFMFKYIQLHEKPLLTCALIIVTTHKYSATFPFDLAISYIKLTTVMFYLLIIIRNTKLKPHVTCIPLHFKFPCLAAINE